MSGDKPWLSGDEPAMSGDKLSLSGDKRILRSQGKGVGRMFSGISAIPSWFYMMAFVVVILLVIFIEWKTR